MKKNFDVKYFMLLFVLIELNNTAVIWNYLDLGPDYWKIPYPACEGQGQSPVDINTAKVIYDQNLTDFNLTDYNNTNVWTFRNTGDFTGPAVVPGGANIAMFQRDNLSPPRISGGNFSGNYRLIQMHIHWGYNDFSGSEHTINGAKYPLELHLVHVDNANNLLMFAFIFQLSENNNSKLDGFIETVNAIPLSTMRRNLTFALGSILPTAYEIASQGYFYYMGSLTLPPCSENIPWVVFNAKIDVSSDQLKAFRINRVLSNWRETQLIYNRTIYSSKNYTTDSSTMQGVKNDLGVFGLMNIFLWNIFN